MISPKRKRKRNQSTLFPSTMFIPRDFEGKCKKKKERKNEKSERKLKRLNFINYFFILL